MRLYYSNYYNRLGDEIQMTALLKHLRSKGIEIDYHDRTGMAGILFPDNLTTFVHGNNGHGCFETRNLWIWAPLLRSRGIYTEVKGAYEPDIDVVFAPVVMPSYNKARGFSNERISELFDLIVSRWPNSLLVVDATHRRVIAQRDKVVFSTSFPQTFDLIRRSKVFLGGDTGTGHYAGGIGHPNMVLLYPDMSQDQWAFRGEVEYMAKHLAEPDFMLHKWDSTPCCDPSHMTILQMDAHSQAVADALEACLLKQ